ncbi:MAG: metal-dependent transcriptional regulator [Planctomycetaceae bacterium]|jgi:DtxR family Mn-dependent transcriptional regulator|nr:metal-dependent transcriptional regulator [Planctomycetaceae bacterium]
MARKRTDLSEAMEDYLEAIYHISNEEKGGARPGLIAQRMKVHKSTVTIALRHLHALSLISYSPYQEVHLTVEGFRHAESVIRRHDLFRRFLLDVLEVEPVLAEKTACRLEHALPQQIVERFTLFVDEYLETKSNSDAKKESSAPIREKQEGPSVFHGHIY